MSSEYFITEFRKTHGRLPFGNQRHFCPVWDGMPIDEDCEEAECCLCFRERTVEQPPKVDWKHAGITLAYILGLAIIAYLVIKT